MYILHLSTRTLMATKILQTAAAADLQIKDSHIIKVNVSSSSLQCNAKPEY